MFKTFIKIMIALLMTCAFAQMTKAATLQETIDKFCRKDCVSAPQLLSAAKRASKSFNVDHRAILAIVHVESKYHTKARNGNSVGLSQVLLTYHRKKFRGTNYYDVDDNIFAGMQVFNECFTRMRMNYSAAFRCYNGGGDPKYTMKLNSAFAMMKNMEHPVITNDPLGSFIEQKGLQ